MRISFLIISIIWAGLFVSFVSGHYEPYGYEFGVMILIISVACLLLAFTPSTTETTPSTYEIALGTAEVDGELTYVSKITRPDGVTVTFYGDSAEEVRRKAIEYIEKGGE